MLYIVYCLWVCRHFIITMRIASIILKWSIVKNASPNKLWNNIAERWKCILFLFYFYYSYLYVMRMGFFLLSISMILSICTCWWTVGVVWSSEWSMLVSLQEMFVPVEVADVDVRNIVGFHKSNDRRLCTSV